MNGRRTAPLVLTLALASGARADDFERLEGRVLADLPGGDLAREHQALSMEQIGTLPRVFRDARTSVLIAKTGEGNPARLLVSPGYRKPASGEGEPVPILVLERFDTFEAGPATTRLAKGRDLMLFPGFLLDLDTGQVVPEDQGGDLRLAKDEKGNITLEALGTAKLYTLARSPLADSAEPGRPSRGRNVLPTDFAGRYRLVANGQWTGTLELSADDQGVLQGRYRSDETGSSYRVAGQVDPSARNLARFSVILPRARMEFDGWLWTEGKGAMAGTMSLLDRSYGFFALREGAAFAPEDVETPLDVSSIQVEPDHVVELRRDGTIALDGKELTRDDLLRRLRAEREKDPGLSLLLRSPAETPHRDVSGVLQALRDAGVTHLRLLAAPEAAVEAPEPR
jgi:hypothetical protein